MFVKFECGCIGILREGKDPIVIRACDSEMGELGFYPRSHMDGKSCRPVPAVLENEIIQNIDRLMADGHNMRTIRRLVAQ